MARDANKKLSLQRSERPEAHTQQKLAQVSPSPGPYLFPALSLSLSLSLPPLSERLKQAVDSSVGTRNKDKKTLCLVHGSRAGITVLFVIS